MIFQKVITTGKYSSKDKIEELIGKGLEEIERELQRVISLRQAIEAGEQSGEPVEWDPKAFKKKLVERIRQRQNEVTTQSQSRG